MMNNGLTSAVSVAKAPLMDLRAIMSHDDAIFAKSTANKVILQNQMLLANLVDRVKIQTPGLVGPSEDRDDRRLRIKEAIRNRGLNPNLEDLFDSADQTVVDENMTVYSPASYFMDLLMYLRNNNLDGKISPDVSRSGKDDSYKGTALGVLFRRRPDLQDLELTPANTSAMLPYIDLVNEIMESFVTHLPEYTANPSGPSPIDSFNVGTQDSDDLLSQPQNVKMDAYRILAGAVYPPTLPYHQPVDAQRAFLNFLGTSRAEILNTFRPKPNLQKFEAPRALDAQYYCEVLGMQQEEFLILTKGVFWEKEFFEISAGLSPMTNEQYQRRVGLRSPLQCWGYPTAEEMFSMDENARTGLSFIKEQLLPRSGLSYTELVDIVSTDFVNPHKPTGLDKIVFESLRYSYKFLQELVDNNGSARYDRMADFVASHVSELDLQTFLERSGLQAAPSASNETTIKNKVKTWIRRNFKSIGRITVIDAGEGPRLKVAGRIVAINRTAAGLPTSSLGIAELTSDGRILQAPNIELSQAPVATLLDDGTVLDYAGNRMGQVGLDSRFDFFIENQPLWLITGGKLTNSSLSDDSVDLANSRNFNKVWDLDVSMGGGGSIDNARLVHLDGSHLSLEAWDRLHRFIRLWRKLGWSTAETDRAVCSLIRTSVPSSQGDPIAMQAADADGTTWGKDSKPFDYQLPVNFEDFEDDFSSDPSQDPNSSLSLPDITFELIGQLAAVKQILSRTHLTLEELLTFFSCMTFEGPKSQYAQLFLTRQLRMLSSVFAPDSSGSYFSSIQTVPIRQHISNIAAALSMRQEDITFLLTPQVVFPTGTVQDVLNMNSITKLYRYALLARTLSVQVKDLFQIMAGFGDPFTSPKAFLRLLDDWEKMADAGFPWPELRYVVDQIPAWADPLALTAYESLSVAASLRAKMIDIQSTHPLDLPVSMRTPDHTNKITSLLLPASTITKIMGLLLGTSISSVPAPAVPIIKFSNLVSLCSHNTAAYIQLLSNSTTNHDKDIPSALQKAWQSSVDHRVCQKPFSTFERVMNGILPNKVIEDELSGKDQVILAPNPIQAATAVDTPSRSIKKTDVATISYPKIDRFLAYYIPFLQAKLTYNSVLDTLATAAGFSDLNIAKTYLENIISTAEKSKLRWQTASMEAQKIPQDHYVPLWKGYLRPTTTDIYQLYAKDLGLPAGQDRPAGTVVLDGRSKNWDTPVDSDSDTFYRLKDSRPASRLDASKLHPLTLTGIFPNQLCWKTQTTDIEGIPSTCFLPADTPNQIYSILTKLQKLALFTNHFKLSSEEILYIHQNARTFTELPQDEARSEDPSLVNVPPDFPDIDLDGIHALRGCTRLYDYTKLRDRLPQNTTWSLIQLFSWATQNGQVSGAELAQKISFATSWPADKVLVLLRNSNFTAGIASEFRNERILIHLQAQLDLSRQMAVPPENLFIWASPLGTAPRDFYAYHAVSQAIQQNARSRFGPTDWTTAVRPVNNLLREHQRAALVDYLLVQRRFVHENSIVDANGLFEFFLIDVQMKPLVETSRIVQAIATVQLFVQRCMLGLEDNLVVTTALDRQRWEWMQNYRVWQANRQIFLYPENWIVPSLRDDKSEIFKKFESELLQTNLSKDAVSTAMRNYVCNLADLTNLKAVGLHVEKQGKGDVHVFAHTRTSPFTFYYNRFRLVQGQSGQWDGWQDMKIQLPAVLDTLTNTTGVYMAPIVFDGRLIVFVPEFTQQTIPSLSANQTFSERGGKPVQESVPQRVWELKMSWTEYRNGSWTPRQTCPQPYRDSFGDGDVSQYILLPCLLWTDGHATGPSGRDIPPSSVAIYLTNLTFLARLADKNLPPLVLAGWTFDGRQTSLMTQARVDSLNLRASPEGKRIFQVHQPEATSPGTDTSTTTRSAAMFSLQGSNISSASLVSPEKIISLDGPLQFVEDADSYSNFLTAKSLTTAVAVQFDQRSRLYSLYNWEWGMHACMALMDSLLKAQQYEQARNVAHYVFDPFAPGDKSDPSRFWKFPPFKVASVATIESLFLELEAGAMNNSISDWRNHPFQPHVVARSRPEAYMKWIVINYIKILIGWGDSLFSQNTLESIPQAIQLYVMASHIYGPRGQIIPRRTNIVPQTFRTLSRKFDAFSNAMVQLEEVFPFSNQTPLPVGKLPLDGDDNLPNIFGSAGTLYFAIPDNPSIRQLAATIDDRLFKIRNSEDLKGNFRVLPLLAPPIDPAMFVQAQAQGLSLSSILQDLQGPLPNCRFDVLLQKAFEVVAEVKALGQSLISIRERHDAEELSLVRQRQESFLQKSLMDIKRMGLQDAQNAMKVLKYNRTAAVSRLSYWLKLVGNDQSGIPAIDQEFQELDAKIAPPLTSGGLALSAHEQEYLDKSGDAQNITATVNSLEISIAAMKVIPDIEFNTQPLGVGESTTIGSSVVSSACDAVARGLSRTAQLLNSQASTSSTIGGHQRALQERVMQANTTGYEISNIDKQITGAQLQIALAEREIEIHQQEIDNAQQLNDYLASKYSSVDLYTYMDGLTKSLSYQTYTTALALAKRVEKAFKYERPQNGSTNYIQAGYWDSTKDGLFAGENLYLSLKRLEATYLDTRGYDYEIVKSISLRGLDPLSLIRLREQGTCDFSLDEIIFDMDFPGHYLRRLKSVSVSIPCNVGPNTSINATLRLLSSEYRISPDLTHSYAKDHTPSSSGTDPRFALAAPPVSAIAVCSASADAGVFTLDFSSGIQRYLPFEGAGAISKWRLDLPKMVKQFNYDSISDVVLQLRYTSLDGGAQLQTAADTAVKAYMKRVEDYASVVGFAAVLDLRNEWAGEWARALAGSAVASAGTGTRVGSADDGVVKLQLGDVRPILPFFTIGKRLHVVKLHLLVDQDLSSEKVSISIRSSGSGTKISDNDAQKLGGDLQDVLPLHHYASERENAVSFGDQWMVKLGNKEVVQRVAKCVLLVEYVLAG
ncbi:toxin subunit protein [Stagonosporopsis vannaccii]|nr:toxin subunit protein [Stagonosporopsis vannaccii]